MKLLRIRRRGSRAARPRLGIGDLVSESLASLASRPARALLTILGTVLGVAALVSTLGLSKTAGNRIVDRFDELAATDIVVEPRSAGNGLSSITLPWDAPARLTRLSGVVAAGNLSDVNSANMLVSGVPLNDPSGQTAFQLPLKAVSPGLFAAVRATLRGGRLPDEGHSVRADRVVVLGANAAEKLHITDVAHQPAIYIGERIYVVIGILASVERQPGLLGAVILPEGTAHKDFGLRAPRTLQVETRIGAASLIASQAPIAVSPTNPKLIKVTAPPEPRRVREGVQRDLDTLFLLLGAVSLLVGAIGIANVTLVAVLERVGEIGLRRSLGATPRHIAAQFLLESTLLGLLGGLTGASVGTLIVVAVAALNTWTPVLEGWVPIIAPLVGAVIGLTSGLYPALKAARLEPVDALRTSL